MRSHIILSMFKVAHAEANVPAPPSMNGSPAVLPQVTGLALAVLLALHHLNNNNNGNMAVFVALQLGVVLCWTS